MATIRKRPGPRNRPVYQAQIIRRGRAPQYRTFDSKADAEAWARRVESDMDRGEWMDRREGERTTVREAFERYEREITPNKALSVQHTERHRLNLLKQRKLARIALARVTGKDVADYIRERQEEGVTANTVRLDLASLSHLYSVARTAWDMPYLINPVPLARMARPKLPRGRDRRLEDSEETRLIEAASAPFAAVLRFALATAMRRGEIAGLTWDRVNVKTPAAYLPKTKNDEPRSVPLSSEALRVLGGLPRRLDGSVFGMSENAITLAMRRACASARANYEKERKDAGLEPDKNLLRGVSFHDLRHEAISRLFERTDLDAMEIAQISGHKTLAMLSRYTHLRAHRLAERLDGAPRGARHHTKHEPHQKNPQIA